LLFCSDDSCIHAHKHRLLIYTNSFAILSSTSSRTRFFVSLVCLKSRLLLLLFFTWLVHFCWHSNYDYCTVLDWHSMTSKIQRKAKQRGEEVRRCRCRPGLFLFFLCASSLADKAITCAETGPSFCVTTADAFTVSQDRTGGQRTRTIRTVDNRKLFYTHSFRLVGWWFRFYCSFSLHSWCCIVCYCNRLGFRLRVCSRSNDQLALHSADCEFLS